MPREPTPSDPADAGEQLRPLYERPGFLLRRAEQKADVMLAETGGDFTRTQFGALYVLSRFEGLDQNQLGTLLHVDRTTTGVVVSLLERKGFVSRDRSPLDRRRKILSLTERGRAALPDIERAAAAAQERLLDGLTAADRAELVRLLKKIVDGRVG